jgi:phosphatidylglycerol:prolipoprotein diacylglycerol transferase
MYPNINILGRDIPVYWLMSILGGCVTALYAYFTNRSRRAGYVETLDFTNMLCLAPVGIILGGKLLGAITMLPVVISNWGILSGNSGLAARVLFSTFVFYGGMLGALATIAVYCRLCRIPFKDVCGPGIPAIPLFHFFGRLGCFFAGCCWGVEADWGIVFTRSLAAPNNVRLIPTQLIEAAVNLLIFAALAVMSRRIARKWLVLPAYFLMYGSARFAIEFFRGDPARGHLWIFSTSQWISLGLIIAAAAMLCREFSRSGKKGSAPISQAGPNRGGGE